MSELNKLIDEIMTEVEKTSSDEPKVEKTSSTKDMFKTKVGDALYKVANLCRGFEKSSHVVTYNDMRVFWESLK